MIIFINVEKIMYYRDGYRYKYVLLCEFLFMERMSTNYLKIWINKVNQEIYMQCIDIIYSVVNYYLI